MPTPSFTITCTRNDVIAKGIHEIAFTRPTDFTFEAGHYVLLDVPLVEDPHDIQTRAYSIASAPTEDELLFVVKHAPEGRMTDFMTKVLQKGTTMRMQGTFGRFSLDRDTEKDYVFICGSTGIAPFISILRTHLASLEGKQIDLFYGVSNEASLFWQEELDSYTKQYPHFRWTLCMSRPSTNWNGFTGYAQDCAGKQIDDFRSKQVYVCGSPLLTKATKEKALNEWGLERKDVKMEGFI